MRHFFAYDAPLSRVLNRIGDLISLSLLWLAASLPVVTAGAATTALYQVTLQIHSGGRYTVTGFWTAFRQHFRRATFLWLPLLLWSGVLLLNFGLISGLDEPAKSVFLGVTLVFGLLDCLLVSYCFPLIAACHGSPVEILKYALVLGLRHPLRTAAILLSNLSPVILFVISPQWFVRLIVLWPFLGVAGIAYCNTLHFAKLLPGKADTGPAHPSL